MGEYGGWTRGLVVSLLIGLVALAGCGEENKRTSIGVDAQPDSTLPPDTRFDAQPDSGLPPDTRADGALPPDTRADAFGVTNDAIDTRPVPDAGADVPADTVVRLDGTVPPDGRIDAGVSPACSDNSPVPRLDDNYVCGTCETDLLWPLVCLQGHLECATTLIANDGSVSTVPPGQYVISLTDYNNLTGRCAYRATYMYPGFALVEPGFLTTDSSAADSFVLRLKAVSSAAMSRPTFDWLKADRTRGEQVIRSLVTLTDMTKNAPIAYTITDPIMDTTWGTETITLRPTTSLAVNAWYRVTVFPAEAQPETKCHTFNRVTTAWLMAPETTDVYTYSRPMVAMVDVGYKSATSGKLVFNFTESLVGTDLTAKPMAQVAIDGIIQSGCLTPYACSGSLPSEIYTLELVIQGMPSSFTDITLRIPSAIRSVKGGTILDGTAGNPNARVDADWTVYTFRAADMTLMPGGSELVWYHGGT